jgi:predicted RNase H-like HicB family nuclease
MTTYTVKASRSGGWWALSVPEVPGVHTQARKMSGAADMAREAIALVMDVDPLSFDIQLEFELDERIRNLVDESRALTREAEATRDEAAARSRAAVRAMLDDGLTQREAAVVMGVSPQRLSQLVSGR